MTRFSMNVAEREPLRLAVLGGSGSGIPVFMAALRASQEQGRLGAIDVRLFGRNSAKLAGVRSYIERSLLTSRGAKGAALSVSTHVQLSEALRDATHIVCLVRAGGMSGRARDEAVALAAGVPPDEGLAAGGLACFLRGRVLISALAARCRLFAPSAVFLQMSSPLGLNVAITRDAFGAATYGVCELPLVTMKAVLAHVAPRIEHECVTARCAGLNHQSWLYAFADKAGCDRTADVLAAIETPDLVAVEPDTIREYGAVPVPYLRLYLHTERVLAAQARSPLRGSALAAWTSNLDRAYRCESAARSDTIRALLAERRMNWFHEGLVPVLEMLQRDEESRVPLNVPCAGSLAGVPDASIIEIDCSISRGGAYPLRAPAMPPRPLELTQRLAAYERAALQLPPLPTSTELAEVLSMHPLTPRHGLHQLARALSTIRPEAA
jgi:6-phospho-beta-glucosidase